MEQAEILFEIKPVMAFDGRGYRRVEGGWSAGQETDQRCGVMRGHPGTFAMAVSITGARPN
jgi:hypothetical protein